MVSSMLALRWIAENVMKYQYSKATIVESIHAIDYSRRLELFEAACKLFAIPMKKRVWSQKQFFAWLRAKFTSWQKTT